MAPLERQFVDAAASGERSVELPVADVVDEARVEAGADLAAGPSSELGFDLGKLAVPSVLLIDENTDRPQANVWCRITDVNGVAVVVKTDSFGRIVSDELLLTGAVSLALFVRPLNQDFARADVLGILEEHAARGISRRPLLSREFRGLLHSGNAAQPDQWKVAMRRWVPLEIAGDGVAGWDLYVALPVTVNRSDIVLLREATSLRGAKLDKDVMVVSEDAFPMVFEAQFDFTVSGTGRVPTPHQWTRERLNAPVPGRVVRAVQFLPSGQVVCATAQANVVPAPHQWPLRLEFAPLVERDAARILATYGQELGSRILSRLDLGDQVGGFNDRVAGRVTSDSGSFHGEIRMTATPIDGLNRAPLGEATVSSTVKWTESASGEWVGEFSLRGLGATEYLLEVHERSHRIVEPKSLRFRPDQVPDLGTFVVRDRLEYVPVVLRIRQPTGGPKNRCFANFMAPYRGRDSWISGFFSPLAESRDGQFHEDRSTWEGHTLTQDFLREESFQVSVQTNGYEKLELTQNDFEWNGHQLVCDRVLRLKPE